MNNPVGLSVRQDYLWTGFFFILLITFALPTMGQEDSYTPALEEVFVTAQKRVETQQEVSAAFSVFSTDLIEKSGWTDVTDMASTVTSLEIIGTTKSRTNVFIRGIGTNKYDIGTEGSVGVFLDGVYVPRFSSVMQNLVDIERIEVLRGPQGTLYGRNTIGGAISVFTAEPSYSYNGKIIAGLGNEDSYDLTAIVTGPLVEDKVLGYLSATTKEQGGFREEVISGKEDDLEAEAIRAKLTFLINDELTFKVFADYSNEETDAYIGEPIFDPTAPTDPLNTTIFAISPLIDATRQAELLDYVAREEADIFKAEHTDPGFTDVEATQIAFLTTWETEDLTMDTTIAYRDETVEEFGDTSRVIYDIYSQDVDQESETLSFEFKVSSEYGGAYSMDDKLEWLAGFFLFEDDAERTDRVIFGEDSVFSGLNTISLTPGFCTPLAAITGDPSEILCATDVGAFQGLWGPAPYDTGATVDLETSSWAIFGQATYYITDLLSLTFGIRHSEDTKEFTYSNDAPQFPAFLDNIATPDVNESQTFTFDDELEFKSTDPKIVLEYTPDTDNDIMYYIGYQEGYKSGGIQFVTSSETLARQSFDKETLVSWEGGIKSRWMDQRLQVNGAVYKYEYEDQQIDGLFNGVLVTSNAGESEIEGIEVDVEYQATSALRLSGSYSYLDAKFKEYFEVSTNTDFSGQTLPVSPKNSFWIAAEHNHDALIDGWQGSARIDYSWRDEQTFAPSSSVLQKNYELVNIGYTLTSPKEDWKVRLFCSNCTDSEFYVSAIPLSSTQHEIAYTGDLRRYGVSVTYSFGEF